MTTLPGWPPTAPAGCTAPGCGTQNTTTVDGVHGRRCAEHPPTFDPARAVHLAMSGRLDTALGYCRTDLGA